MEEGVDPDLLHAWVAGRSLARGLPLPVADHGGWRVDVGSESEICRWIYAAPIPRIGEAAQTHPMPGYQVKVCARAGTLAALVPADWTVEATGWFMVGGAMPRQDRLPDGYQARIVRDPSRIELKIIARDGTEAATGYAGETEGGFAYDRIVTQPDHRRRGLGRAIMARLATEKRVPTAPDLLVATEMGRALYESLGWRVLSPYATAFSPRTLV